MLNAILMAVVMLAGFGFFAFTMRNKIALLLKAKPENRFDNLRERIGGMVYIAFGQRKMFKDPVPGLMHALIFWGFLALLLRSILLMLSPFGAPSSLPGAIGHFYTFFKDITEIVVALMVLYAVFRRVVLKPERVTQSSEAYLILGLIFTLMITDFIYDGAKFAQGRDLAEMKFAPAGAFFAGMLGGAQPGILAAVEHGMFWIHIITLFVFLNLLPYSKHFHVITSIPNVFFQKLDPPGAIAPIKDIENQEVFGVGKVEDFTWKQILDTYSCTECGRCTVNCPAWQTGKALNPKFMQVDIRDHLKEKAPHILGKNGEYKGKSLIEAVKEEVIWQCTTCRSCEENCPVTIIHVDKIVDMRR
ncbi:MAG: (Fe-S)-binding protein, partial [Deltaproteobacteria bacterium]|nr:(Fe-S)-binding protein [Deltaproteobacteria bacterium]